jgi:hypothetical protein
MAIFVAQVLRSRWASVACLAVVVLALVLPRNGPGIPLCQFKRVTGLPCFGCGLTRSFIGMAHLDVARAGFFNPLGVVLFPMVALVALLLPAPARARDRLARWAEGHSRQVDLAGWMLLGGFILNGIGRIAWLKLTAQPSPW